MIHISAKAVLRYADDKVTDMTVLKGQMLVLNNDCSTNIGG